jgi:hypothetical protein
MLPTWGSIADDVTAPDWARRLARELPGKNPVDVLNVLEVLVGVAHRHLEQVAEANAIAGYVKDLARHRGLS